MTRILKTPFRSRSGVLNSRFLNLAKFVHLSLTSKNLETPWIPTLNHHQLQMEYTHWFGSMKPSGRFRQDISMGTPKIWKKIWPDLDLGGVSRSMGSPPLSAEIQVKCKWLSAEFLKLTWINHWYNLLNFGGNLKYFMSSY